MVRCNNTKVAPRLNTTVIDTPRSQAYSAEERWYVLIVMCLVYAISIADRYVVSTVLEPIRTDLKTDRCGRGLPRRAPRLVLRVFRHSDVLARRPQETAATSSPLR